MLTVPPAGASGCFTSDFELKDEIIAGVTFGGGESATVVVVVAARLVGGAVVVVATVVAGAAVVAVAGPAVVATVLDDEVDDAAVEGTDCDDDGASIVDVVVVVVVVVETPTRNVSISGTATIRSPLALMAIAVHDEFPSEDTVHVEPLSCDNQSSSPYSDAAIVVPSRDTATFRNGTVSDERVQVAPESVDVHNPSLPTVSGSSSSLRATRRLPSPDMAMAHQLAIFVPVARVQVAPAFDETQIPPVT